ncbi:MAG: hypothetical protein AAF802_30880 [Planctomycetota bacterium]
MRTLLCLPVMVALYFSLGIATKQYGRADVTRVFEAEHGGGLPGYVCPLVFEHWRMKAIGGPNASPNGEVEARYFLWFFVFVWETPYVRTQQVTMRGPQTFQDISRETSWASSWR